MPIYEFVCENCGHEFEELVMSSDNKKCKCPKCKKRKVKKLISTVCTRSAGSEAGSKGKQSDNCAPGG